MLNNARYYKDSYSVPEFINLLGHKSKMYEILHNLDRVEMNWDHMTYGSEECYGIEDGMHVRTATLFGEKKWIFCNDRIFTSCVGQNIPSNCGGGGQQSSRKLDTSIWLKPASKSSDDPKLSIVWKA